MRALVGALAALLATATFVVAAPADASSSDLAAARARANAAAAELAEANGRLLELRDEVDRLEAEAERAANAVEQLQSTIQHLAIVRYKQGPASMLSMFGATDVNEASRASALARYVADDHTDAIDEYRAAKAKAEEAQAVLDRRIDDQRDAIEALEEKKAAVESELRKLEAEEAARRQAAAAAAARQRAPASRSVVSDAAPTVLGGGGEWLCPVAGAHAFSNDWGAPRSGGRTHQGNDIFAAYGTPVVASVAGSVSFHASSLGGNAYYLHGVDGNTYYGAHLSRYGSSGTVSQGTVVGYVGDSGNAQGSSPHLHFEIHPGGGSAVNPYPTLAQYC